MATAEQIKALIKSHFGDLSDQFYSVALQIAAHEARQGHVALANEIRDAVESEKGRRGYKRINLPQELNGLIYTEEPNTSQSALVINPTLQDRISRIILEYRQQNKLKQFALKHRRKLLLVGPPGTGKTMTARVLARELHLPLYTIQMDRMITKFMGETGAKLRQIFDMINQHHGIYLFDEFDAIGGERSKDNDVGEMRRVLNSFLQFIENDMSDSLIIAATNNISLLDNALFRRFDDVLIYSNPDKNERKQLISNLLSTFSKVQLSWPSILKESDGLSHAQIDAACRDAIKSAILSDQGIITTPGLIEDLKTKKLFK